MRPCIALFETHFYFIRLFAERSVLVAPVMLVSLGGSRDRNGAAVAARTPRRRKRSVGGRGMPKEKRKLDVPSTSKTADKRRYRHREIVCKHRGKP
ncbi:unnamed protein product, partial [Pylaiella littoralis]